MNTCWLGYNGLALPYAEIAAVLFYRSVLDARIVRAYGYVPGGVRSVVVTADGEYLPARWTADQLRRRWVYWRDRH